jgi:maltooligosyltrehalose synthase
MADLWQKRYSAKIKLWLVHRLFNERKQNKEAFSEGTYIPLAIEGEYKENVLAFAKQHQNQWYLITVPLHLAALSLQQQKEMLHIDWKDTRIIIPGEAPKDFEHLFSGIEGTYEKELFIKDIFKSLPLAVLKSK